MQAASVSYRAYAIDLWGFGDTAKNIEKYGIAQQVNLVQIFCEKMGIGKIALIGHGLGAIVALNFAAGQPESVDRIMITGFPLTGSSINSRLGTATPSELVEWLLGRHALAETTRSEAQKADQHAILTSLENPDIFDWDTLSRRICTPCLFVQGTNDPLISAPNGDDPNPVSESMHQISFDDSGHFPMLDETSKFNRLMADFLALPTGESPRQLQLKEEWKRRVR
jgi:pimeloyl-ACP methyl ester carboxylesterase